MVCSGNSTWEILRGVGDLGNENQFVFSFPFLLVQTNFFTVSELFFIIKCISIISFPFQYHYCTCNYICIVKLHVYLYKLVAEYIIHHHLIHLSLGRLCYVGIRGCWYGPFRAERGACFCT